MSVKLIKYLLKGLIIMGKKINKFIYKYEYPEYNEEHHYHCYLMMSRLTLFEK